MSDRSPAVELRRSVSLLSTEWWLFAGALAGYLLYGVWVVTTGLAVESLAPTLASAPVAAVGPTTVTGLTAFAAVAWLLAPAAVAAWLLDRRLSNDYGNLVSQYRIDHPGVLPAPSGALMVLAAVAALALGPLAPVVAVMAVAAVHLLVRTIAFGRRVYSFSPRPLFSVLAAVSAVALAGAWLVHAPGLPAPVGPQVAGAGVPAVVATGLSAAGLDPSAALGALVAVPAALAGAYLAVQTLVARRVRARAPLSNPQKRAEQRYPIMPPVADSSRPGPPTRDEGSSAEPSTAGDGPDATATSSADDESATAPEDDGVEPSGDDRSHTRVFTTDDPIPDDDEPVATVAGEGDQPTEDGWIDDTAIFTPEGAGGSPDECDACGESVPRESVTFCPNCGERL